MGRRFVLSHVILSARSVAEGSTPQEKTDSSTLLRSAQNDMRKYVPYYELSSRTLYCHPERAEGAVEGSASPPYFVLSS